MLIKIKDYKVHRLNKDIFQIYIKTYIKYVKYCHAYIFMCILCYIYVYNTVPTEIKKKLKAYYTTSII